MIFRFHLLFKSMPTPCFFLSEGTSVDVCVTTFRLHIAFSLASRFRSRELRPTYFIRALGEAHREHLPFFCKMSKDISE